MESVQEMWISTHKKSGYHFLNKGFLVQHTISNQYEPNHTSHIVELSWKIWIKALLISVNGHGVELTIARFAAFPSVCREFLLIWKSYFKHTSFDSTPNNQLIFRLIFNQIKTFAFLMSRTPSFFSFYKCRTICSEFFPLLSCILAKYF